ncbi:hypothetical protein BH24ACT26_BH24ACT26_13350 [soil metagenome]
MAGLLLAAVAAFVALPSARSASAPVRRSSGRASEGPLPRPVRPAFAVPRPLPLSGDESVSHWAPVLRSVRALAEPDASAAPVAVLETQTPEGTANIALVLEAAADAEGRLWARVRLPVLPNNSTAWVPRRALGGYTVVRTHLVIDVERLSATLYRGQRTVFTADVGVGRPSWPTPTGEFYVRNKLTSFDSPTYGPLAFGTSARSDVLTDWPAGGFIGIHGTDEPELLPGAVSHGCIRMRNADILELGRLMPVGTPLTIR